LRFLRCRTAKSHGDRPFPAKQSRFYEIEKIQFVQDVRQVRGLRDRHLAPTCGKISFPEVKRTSIGKNAEMAARFGASSPSLHSKLLALDRKVWGG